MASIDRSLCPFNADLGGCAGVVTVGGRRFDVFVKAWAGDWEAAWGKAEQAAELLLSRFPEVEAAVASQLAPELDHWTDEPVTVAEITERVVRAMQTTAVGGLHTNESGCAMQVSDPYLRRLADLWSPPSTRYHTGTLIGFERMEKEMGLTLPAAYKELVHAYGQGVWFETVFVLNPFYAWLEGLEPWYSPQHGCGIRTWCDELRKTREQFPQDFVYPIYPEPGGIFPYALFYGIRGALYWSTAGPPDRWPSLFDLGGPASQQEWERFAMPVTELFWRLATEDKAVKGTSLDAAISGFRSTVFEAIRW